MIINQVIARVGAGVLLLATAGCNLENELDVVLPAYQNELVVEGYLEAGTLPRLTVLESGAYLPTPSASGQPTVTLPTAALPVLGIAGANGLGIKLPVDVTVNLTLPSGQVMPLRFAPGLDPTTGKYFTHIGTAPLTMQPGQRFALDVRDTRGHHITGTAGVPTFVPIDSARYGFNGLSGSDKKANFITRWTDVATTTDYYRLLLSNRRDPNDTERSYLFTDQFTNGQTFTALTTYRFEYGDTITATLFHMDPAYYAFQESVRGAILGNGNPLGQPARIRSTVQGGIGVFAVLVADRRTLILR